MPFRFWSGCAPIGRLSALYATQGGQTVIDGENVSRASLMVQRISKTINCPDGGGPEAAR